MNHDQYHTLQSISKTPHLMFSKNLQHTHRQLHLYIKIYLQCIFGAFFWAIFRNTAMPDNFQNKVGSQPLFGKTLKKIIQICGRRHP